VIDDYKTKWSMDQRPIKENSMVSNEMYMAFKPLGTQLNFEWILSVYSENGKYCHFAKIKCHFAKN
jgi:hypothetical protein